MAMNNEELKAFVRGVTDVTVDRDLVCRMIDRAFCKASLINLQGPNAENDRVSLVVRFLEDNEVLLMKAKSELWRSTLSPEFRRMFEGGKG